MDNNEGADFPAYIARCKCGCGAIVFAAVDDPRHADDVARDVAECIRDGYTIERSTVGVVRTEPFGCQAKKKSLKNFWISQPAQSTR